MKKLHFLVHMCSGTVLGSNKRTSFFDQFVHIGIKMIATTIHDACSKTHALYITGNSFKLNFMETLKVHKQFNNAHYTYIVQ